MHEYFTAHEVFVQMPRAFEVNYFSTLELSRFLRTLCWHVRQTALYPCLKNILATPFRDYKAVITGSS